MTYPTTFSESLQPLDYQSLGPAGRQAYDRLKQAGYEVMAGLTPAAADTIAKLAQEAAIKEYCPKDSSERFTDQEAAAKWLSKGRAAFLLVRSSDQAVVGYGWAGPGTSGQVPGGETTFAIRLAEAGQGQGLASPYSRLIISGAAILFGAKNIWLETWGSNGAAVHIYHKFGAVDVASIPSERSTATGDTTQDTRLYMTLPDELLNP